MIVFLAVPALQRNSRNTQLKNDVGSVLGYVNEFATNNGGTLPGSICSNATTGYVNMSATTTCTAPTATNNVGKVSTGTTVAHGTAISANLKTITVVFNTKCASATALESPTGNSPRSIAAAFRVETGGGDSTQCQEG